MEYLDMVGPPVGLMILTLIVSPFAQEVAKMFGAILTGACGMLVLLLPLGAGQLHQIWWTYKREVAAEERRKACVQTWTHACAHHVYRGHTFKPPIMPSKPESNRVSPPLVIAFFIAALVVGIHFGSNT